jgi:acetoin utilization deacetylase AcuC-like enzyme
MCRPPTHHVVGNAQCCRGASPKNSPFGFCHLNGLSAAICAVRDHARAIVQRAFFRPESTLEDVLCSQACSLEASLRVTNGSPLGCSFVLPVGTVNCVQTLKAPSKPAPRACIIDVDVHHGNANEDTWFKSPEVLHVNFNEKGIWPGPQHGDPAAVGMSISLC